MSEIFGFEMDFGGADLPDDYDCPDVAEGDDETVDPAELDASEDVGASGDKMKIDPLGGDKPSPSFGCGCSDCFGDCSGSCWLTCSGSCNYRYEGTMN